MAHLERAKIIALMQLVYELSLELPDNPKCAQLADSIVKADSYAEELTKNILSRITFDREEMEARDIKIADEQAVHELELKRLELQARNNTAAIPRKEN